MSMVLTIQTQITYAAQFTKLFIFFTFHVVDLMYKRTFIYVTIVKHRSTITKIRSPKQFCSWSMYVTIMCQNVTGGNLASFFEGFAHIN